MKIFQLGITKKGAFPNFGITFLNIDVKSILTPDID